MTDTGVDSNRLIVRDVKFGVKYFTDTGAVISGYRIASLDNKPEDFGLKLHELTFVIADVYRQTTHTFL